MSLIEKYIETVSPAIKEADNKFPGPHDFVHLHNHTLFSPLDGVASPDDYFAGCAYFGLPAFAITDHGTMASIPDAFFAAKQHKIKQIPGCEFYFNDFHTKVEEMKESGVEIAQIKAQDPELWERYTRNRHLTILAKNMDGYRSMLHMSSHAWLHNARYNKARINLELLRKHKDGLVVISGCLNGPVCHELRMGIRAEVAQDRTKADSHFKKAIKYIYEFKKIFGDDYYLEFQLHGAAPIEFARETYQKLYKIHEMTGINGIISNDCHYLMQRDFQLQKVMMACDQGLVASDPNLFHVNCDEQFFKTRSQLRSTFITHKYDEIMPLAKFEEFCDNTVAIHEKCNGFTPDMSPKLPSIPNADIELIKRVRSNMKSRGLWDNPNKYMCDGKMVTYREQAELELKRIIEKKFSSYFLIVQDLIKYSTDTLKMPVGPGRGSTAGCLVSFVLDIHQMDPLLWGLSFSRFMSESRGGYLLDVSM